jgi:site-specific DNA recombinase
MAAIEDGMYQPAMKARMDELERQKADILTRMKDVPADVPDIHPNVAEVYRRRAQHLAAALDDPEMRAEAAEAIRSAVDEVVLKPKTLRAGDLNLDFNSEERMIAADSLLRYQSFCVRPGDRLALHAP